MFLDRQLRTNDLSIFIGMKNGAFKKYKGEVMLKKYRISILFLLFFSVIFIAACSDTSSEGSDSDTASADASETTITIGNTQDPSHPINVALEEMKAEIDENTNGEITVDIYPSGQLGASEFELLDQIVLGSLDAGLLMGGPALVSSSDGRGQFEELPFLFENKQEARDAYDGEVGEWVTENIIEPQGVKVINYWESGFRNITNNIRPITEPSDLDGIKLRVDSSEIRADTFNTLGAAATPMNFGELFTALQQGTVDGQENPLSIITSSQFYEVQEYLSITEHIYNTSTLVINPELYENLTDDQKEVVNNAAENAKVTARELLDEETESAIEYLEEQGMEINEVDKQPFIEAVQPIWDAYIEEYGSELIDLTDVSN